jgi:hypothetical protein
MDAVMDTLRQLELERGERIKTAKTDGTKDRDAQQRTTRGKRPWLRDRGVVDADEPAIEATPGEAPAEFQ